MSTHPTTASLSRPIAPGHVAVLRAVAALVWAAALSLAAGDAGPDRSVGLALLVAVYPLIDVVASLAGPAAGGADAARQRINVAVGLLAAAGLAAAGLGSGTSGVLVVFGAWAVVSGLLQLRAAAARRHAGARETPMLVSGGLSAVAGVAIAASSGADEPSLAMLSGNAAFGAVLFLVWAYRGRDAA